ncbi:hypothetical protein QFZ76_005623 [Streptomyces sp. V4I2]|nr:hypothetical protein [Streptomyces sp. V4I2]
MPTAYSRCYDPDGARYGASCASAGYGPAVSRWPRR